jgi:hypothetical protein
VNGTPRSLIQEEAQRARTAPAPAPAPAPLVTPDQPSGGTPAGDGQDAGGAGNP